MDWTKVAQLAGYTNANTAKVRFGQIKKAIGYNAANGSHPIPSPAKARTPKKDNNVGSGTNTSPSKVEKKPRAPRKPKAVKVAPKPEAQIEGDENTVKDEVADELDVGSNGFENALHEQLYNGYQVASYEDEFQDAEEEA